MPHSGARRSLEAESTVTEWTGIAAYSAADDSASTAAPPAIPMLAEAAADVAGASSSTISRGVPAETNEQDAPMVNLMSNLGHLSEDVYSIAFSSLLLGTRQKGVQAGVVVCMGTLCCALQVMLLYLLYETLIADGSPEAVESDWKLPTSQALVLTVVYASVAKDYGNALKMMRVLRSGRSVMRFTGSMSKFMCAVILPVMQATVAHGVVYLAALIIAQATDTAGVILNGLSVVFIADIDEYVSVRLEGFSEIDGEGEGAGGEGAERAGPARSPSLRRASSKRLTMPRAKSKVAPMMRLETFGPDPEDDAIGFVEAFIAVLPRMGGMQPPKKSATAAAAAAVAAAAFTQAGAAGAAAGAPAKQGEAPSVVLQIEGAPAAKAAMTAGQRRLQRFARIVHTVGRTYVFAGGLAMLGYCLFDLPDTRNHIASLTVTIACFLAAFYFVTPDF